jgi:Bacterial Ig domain
MTGSQGWGRVTVSFLVWGACVGIVLGTLLLFSHESSTSAAADNTPSTFIWFADNKTLKQISTATQEVIQSYHLEEKPLALALDPTDKALWVLGKRELLKLDAEVNRLLEIDLKALTQQRSDTQGKDHKGNKHEHDKKEGLEKAEFLALNPYDQSVWIAGEKTLLHLDKDGTLLQSTVLPDKVRAIALNLDDTLWVMGERHIWQVQADGSFTEPFGLPETIAAPKNDDNDDHGDRSGEPKHIRFIALDPLGEVLWVANLRHLARINLKDSSDAVIISHDAAQIPPEKNKHKGKQEKEHGESKRDYSALIYDVSVDPRNGTLWLLTEDQLISFDRGGNPDVTIPLPDDVKKPEHLAFDPIGQDLWISGKGSVGHVDLTDNRVTSIAVDKSVEALGVAPFHLVPQLSLIEPADGIHTNNAALLIRLGLAATCNGTRCDVGETYSSAFQVDASLNAMPIGALFQVGNGEALYQPSLALGDGTYALTAQVIDAFGHGSNPINAPFTIDTVTPQFVDIEPPDGTILNQTQVTIGGHASETATVVLRHPGGDTSIGVENFAFLAGLKEGTNSFGLSARDPAGNETSISLTITLDTIPPPVPDIGLILLRVSDDGMVTLAGKPGSVEHGAEVVIINNRTGASVTITADSTGAFTARIAAVAGDTFTIILNDAASNTSVPIELSAPGPAGATTLMLYASPSSGLAPLTVTFSLVGEPLPATVTLDREGDGITDFTGLTLEGQTFTYTTPGRFLPIVSVTDDQGNKFSASAELLVEDQATLNALLQSQWAGMKTALQQGNIQGALQFLASESRPAFEAMFRELASVLTTVGADLGEIRLVEVREGLAEYELLAVEHGRSVSYYVEFVRDENEQWHLKFF